MRVADESFKDLIERTLTGIRDALIREMDIGGFNASGRTKASLQVHAEDYYGELIGLRSFQTLVAERITDGGRGRGPTYREGTGVVYRSILQWMEYKGIVPEKGTKEALAYAITKKIHQSGTQIYRGQRQGIDLKGIAKFYIDMMMQDIPNIVFTNLKRKIEKDGTNNNATT